VKNAISRLNRIKDIAKRLFLLTELNHRESERAKAFARSHPPKQKAQQNQRSAVSRLTKPRRELKADAALLIKGVNARRSR
jgi:hypothetical protein